jgi:hypothetical protein
LSAVSWEMSLSFSSSCFFKSTFSSVAFSTTSLFSTERYIKINQ